MRLWTLTLTLGCWLVASSYALAHAFPQRSEPRVGATLDTPPAAVKIWFSADLEAAFSTLHVLDQANATVTTRERAVEATDPRLLQVKLPPLSPGRYTVEWNVLSVDGHRTTGHFVFSVRSDTCKP